MYIFIYIITKYKKHTDLKSCQNYYLLEMQFNSFKTRGQWIKSVYNS